MRYFLLLTMVVYCSKSHGQAFDSFDTEPNSAWVGQVDRFVISDGAWRLQAPAVAEQTYVAIPSTILNQTVWSLDIRMDFATSSTSLSRFYLAADQSDLSGDLNGYFVQVGDTPDEVSLYRQDGNSEVLLIDGLDKTVDGSSVSVRVIVTRNVIGEWTLWRQQTGLNLEGTAIDNTYSSSQFAGIVCTYIASRSSDFYFDNFHIRMDNTPPRILQVDAAEGAVDVQFDEELLPVSVAVPAFRIDGEPVDGLEVLAPDRIRLFYSLQAGRHGLSVSGIADLLNNVANEDIDFTYDPPQSPVFRDVVFSELLVDPDPTQGLPEVEYVELVNRSDKTFELANWMFSDERDTVHLSDYRLEPGAYVLLVESDSKDLFNSPAMGLDNFPSLNNSGEALSLRSDKGTLIDALTYGSDASLDGRSLELISLAGTCSGAFQYAPSEASLGGTPGAVNSLEGTFMDFRAPVLESVRFLSEDSILFEFSEALDTARLENVHLDFMPNQTGELFADDSQESLVFVLDSPWPSSALLDVSLSNVCDCYGNALGQTSRTLVRGASGRPEDIRMSELLFNPHPDGEDFVEIFNASETMYYDLSGWAVVTFNEADSIDEERLLPKGTIIAPSGWLVLTNDEQSLLNEFPETPSEVIVEMDLPALNDNEDRVALMSSGGVLHERVNYEADWHFDLLNDDEGVSLERLSYEEGVNNAGNWRSAAESVGFGTPGRANSQQFIRDVNGSFLVEPSVFVPGSAGLGLDFAVLSYSLERSGWLGSLEIFDARGRLIRTLIDQSTLSQEGFIRWDGVDNQGGKASLGYYVAVLRLFNLQGDERVYRAMVGIGGY